MIGKGMKTLRNAFLPAPAAGALAAVAGTLLLSGCLRLGGKTPDQLYRLTAEDAAPAGSSASGLVSDAIVVLDPEADRGLDVLRVPVRVDSSTVAYLKDAQWIERPTRQFRSLLAETLRARTGRLVIEGGDLETSGSIRIGGRLLQMGYDAPTQSVVVRFDAVRGAGAGQPLETRRFESVVANVAPKAVEVGPAINRAANDVARQVADWVKAG